MDDRAAEADPREWYVDVAADARVGERGRLLTYALPEAFRSSVGPRQLVWVPLRDEIKPAVVVRAHRCPPGFPVRPVHAPVEPCFRLSESQWALVEWLSDETLCSLFEAAAPFLPPGVGHRGVEHLRLRADAPAQPTLTPVQRRLVELLGERGEISLDAARRALNRALTTVIPELERAGVIERVARVQLRPTRLPSARYVRPLAGVDLDLSRAPAQRRTWEVVRRRAALGGGQPLAWEDLVRRPGVTAEAVRSLAARGALEILDLPAPARERVTASAGAAMVQLTAEQGAAWRSILASLRSDTPDEFLLHGITGSGKTEIYLRATAWCLGRGRQVIVLVPEIALASQVVARFTERFPGQVAVLHSALPDAERYQTWSAAAEGRIPVIVGPRSALFAPLERVGLIIIDEEHEGSYKQDSPPRYDARQVARRLARLHRSALILGSATPDVATYWAAREGPIRLLELAERVGPLVLGPDGRAERRPLGLPEVERVDMRLELQQGNTHIFSRSLQHAVGRAVASGEQAILFLNRRGSSTFVQCRACGHVETCPFCEIPLVFHADRGQLVCHRCNERRPPPRSCPECASQAIGYYGTGTQRVESEVRRLLPEARVLRWDQDALRRGVEHRHLIEKVLRHEVDVVVGTQMVAKGLDFPLVSTIGVINADTLLHLPDFRSGERTFQILTQVAGRAGRRAPGGRVIFQSYTPDHYAVRAASRHDYLGFYEEEIAFRRQHGYPPYRRLVRLVYRHTDEVTCQAVAEEVAEELARSAIRRGLRDVDLLGPTPAFTAKLRGRYQWQLVVRGGDAHDLLAGVDLDPGWLVDVDPVSLL
ncbi:MAG TPA: primosomal protein N' [Thermomicrobiaceae bacterium]|nr:primosomal protein N' [Thermomicrobiaceae bacterium]